MTFIPSGLHWDVGYLVTLTALVGTTIAPWQFFYLQAGFVEKKVGPRHYPQARLDVLFGSISCMVIVFFIIICTAATLHASGTDQYHRRRRSREGPCTAGREVRWPTLSLSACSTLRSSPPPSFRSPPLT